MFLIVGEAFKAMFCDSLAFTLGHAPIAMSRSVIMPMKSSFSVTGSRLHQSRCTANRVFWFAKLHVSAHVVSEFLASLTRL